MSDDRDHGIEFGDLADDLEAASYPLTEVELLERFGDREVKHASGTVALSEVLTGDDETYRDADQVQTRILNMVGEAAVGREGYSDRGVGQAGEDDREDEDSF